MSPNDALYVLSVSSTTSSGGSGFEYRTAHKIQAIPEQTFADYWDVYVDAITGDILASQTNTVCD